jgi:hypothetical protein
MTMGLLALLGTLLDVAAATSPADDRSFCSDEGFAFKYSISMPKTNTI